MRLERLWLWKFSINLGSSLDICKGAREREYRRCKNNHGHNFTPTQLRPVHNTTLNNALCRVVFASTPVETQHNAWIDSDPILAFPCVAFLRQVVKNPPTFLVINLCVSRINATQGLASLCEPALSISNKCITEYYVLPWFTLVTTCMYTCTCMWTHACMQN